jgi:hypothetical protein
VLIKQLQAERFPYSKIRSSKKPKIGKPDSIKTSIVKFSVAEDCDFISQFSFHFRKI